MGIMCTKCKVKPGQASHSYCKDCQRQYHKDRKEKRAKELELLERLDVGLKAWETRRKERLDGLGDMNQWIQENKPETPELDVEALMSEWDTEHPQPTLEVPDFKF